jgi:hypothetical protein
MPERVDDGAGAEGAGPLSPRATLADAESLRATCHRQASLDCLKVLDPERPIREADMALIAPLH